MSHNEIEQRGRLLSGAESMDMELETISRQASTSDCLDLTINDTEIFVPISLTPSPPITKLVFENRTFYIFVYILALFTLGITILSFVRYPHSLLYDHFVEQRQQFIERDLVSIRWPSVLSTFNGPSTDTSKLRFSIRADHNESAAIGIDPSKHGIVTTVLSEKDALSAANLFKSCVLAGSRASFHVIFNEIEFEIDTNGDFQYQTHFSHDPFTYTFNMSLYQVLHLSPDSIAVKNPDPLILTARPVSWAPKTVDTQGSANAGAFAVKPSPIAFADMQRIKSQYGGTNDQLLFSLNYIAAFLSFSSICSVDTFATSSIWINIDFLRVIQGVSYTHPLSTFVLEVLQ
ncbi:hypothetical protein PCE1_003989 [Barthelona sp. PCE]